MLEYKALNVKCVCVAMCSLVMSPFSRELTNLQYFKSIITYSSLADVEPGF